MSSAKTVNITFTATTDFITSQSEINEYNIKLIEFKGEKQNQTSWTTALYGEV